MEHEESQPLHIPYWATST